MACHITLQLCNDLLKSFVSHLLYQNYKIWEKKNKKPEFYELYGMYSYNNRAAVINSIYKLVYITYEFLINPFCILKTLTLLSTSDFLDNAYWCAEWSSRWWSHLHYVEMECRKKQSHKYILDLNGWFFEWHKQLCCNVGDVLKIKFVNNNSSLLIKVTKM